MAELATNDDSDNEEFCDDDGDWRQKQVVMINLGMTTMLGVRVLENLFDFSFLFEFFLFFIFL